MFRKLKFLLVLGATSVYSCSLAQAVITVSVFTDPHTAIGGNGTIGFTYAGNIFVGSLQASGLNGVNNPILYSTDLTGGNVQLFAPGVTIASSPSDEHFVASSFGLGGFPNRDVYVASGNGVLHITNDGTSSNSFVGGLSGDVRAILFDSVGTFGNNMLVATSTGNIYRVDSAGAATLLASVGEDAEGMDIAPIGTLGPAGGTLIVASEGSGKLRSITPGGAVSDITTVAGAEEVSVVPLNLGLSGNPVEGFYGSNYTPNVVKADVNQFLGLQGDLIVTGEFTHLISRVHWNGSTFDVIIEGSFPNQPEDGIFVTADIIQGNVPEPSTIIIWSLLGGLGFVFAWRRRKAA
ncbi:MAG: PEP-CTERM sorting domain-containing protein [Pirellulales bacterium]|nr:PEP-CTERM sorting domain-containing protein [Pirellulales bacterium]